MKRILAVLMSTAMVLSLAACSQETAKTPEEIYDEALVKSMSLDALDGDMEIAMDMDMGGMTLGMKMSADMQIKKISDTESEMAMVMNTSILGQEVVQPAGDDEGLPHRITEAGGEIQTALGVDGVIILTDQHLSFPSLRQAAQICGKFFYDAAFSLWITLWITWKTTHA